MPPGADRMGKRAKLALLLFITSLSRCVAYAHASDVQYGCVEFCDEYGCRDVCDTHYYHDSDGVAYYWDGSYGAWVGPRGYWRGGAFHRGFYPGYHDHWRFHRGRRR